MSATSPRSLLASLTIHAFVAALIFLSTIYLAQRAREQPVIFELVAGAPTAPDELVAPAQGNTLAPVKLEVPTVEKVASMVEPEPEAPARPEEKPVPKAKPDMSIAKEMKKAQRMSYKDYLKKHPTPKPAAPTQDRRPANIPRVDAQGIATGVKGGSTTNTRGGGGGNALAREQQNQMDTYFSLLVQELRRAHEAPPGISDKLVATVTFDITASGAILNPRITKSSGDKAFDESVLEAFLRMRSIGPTPNRRSDTVKVNFKMQDER